MAVGGEVLAASIHAENGKALVEARTGVLAGIAHLEFVIASAERVLGRRSVPSTPTAPNRGSWVEHLPYGIGG